jgi:hypothetical protein
MLYVDYMLMLNNNKNVGVVMSSVQMCPDSKFS